MERSRGLSGFPEHRAPCRRTTGSHPSDIDFTEQLTKRRPDASQHVAPERRQPIDAGCLGSLGCRRAKPAAPLHAGQHGIECARTQPVPVPLELVEHPLSVDTRLIRVMQDVDLPERQQELPRNRIAHPAGIIARSVNDIRLRS